MKIDKHQIKQKDLIFLEHFDDDNQTSFHPFLILYKSQHKLLGIQFTSVHKDGSTHYGMLPTTSHYMKVIQSYSDREKQFVTIDNPAYLKHKSISSIDTMYDFYLNHLPTHVKYAATMSDQDFEAIVKLIDMDESSWDKEIFDLLGHLVD